jgi:chromosome segregation ATPase
MYNYEKKIKELGLQKSSLPKSLMNPIKELDEAEKELAELKTDLANLEEGDESADDIKSQIAEYENLIVEADTEIVAKIQTYADKKPYYDAKYQHMKQAAEAKKAAKTQESAPAVESGTIPVEGSSVTFSATPEVLEAVNQPEVVVASQGAAIETKEEKKDDFGTWLFWGLLGTAGILVGVNLFKNRR